MNCPHCATTMNGGLIFCRQCWNKLPHVLTTNLVWLHPDVAKHRKTPVKPGSYEQLLQTAVNHLKWKEQHGLGISK